MSDKAEGSGDNVDVLPGRDNGATLPDANLPGRDNVAALSVGDNVAALPGCDNVAALPGGDNVAALPGCDNVAALPGRDNVAALPGRDNVAALPGSDTGAALPGRDNVAALPGRDNVAALPGSDNVAALPGRDNVAALPGCDNLAALPDDNDANFPSRDNVAALPGGDNVAALPGGDNVAALSGGDNVAALPDDNDANFPSCDNVAALPGGDNVAAGDNVEAKGIRACSSASTPSQGKPLETEESIYKMDKLKRGIAIIINNVLHRERVEQTGSDKDHQTLKQRFKELGFDMREFKDLKRDQIEAELINVAGEDHTDNDCLVCVILSHGTEGTVCGVDHGQSIEGHVDGRINGCLDGCVNLNHGHINGYINCCINGRIDDQKDGRIDDLKDGRIDGYFDGRIDVQGDSDICVDDRIDGHLKQCPLIDGHINGCVDGSIHGHINGQFNGKIYSGDADVDTRVYGRINGQINCKINGEINGQIDITKLTAPFKGDKCTCLAGKPKLFFIQTCRGQMEEQTDTPGGRESETIPIEIKVRIPTEADFLIAYSVVPDHVSCCDSTKGSWFVQAISEVFGKHGQKLDLMALMTRVNKLMAYKFMTNVKKIPCITSMLRKDVYFRPK